MKGQHLATSRARTLWPCLTYEWPIAVFLRRCVFSANFENVFVSAWPAVAVRHQFVILVLTFLAPNSLHCADGAVKNLLTHSLTHPGRDALRVP